MDVKMLMESVSYDPAYGSFEWKERPLHHFADARSQKSWNTKCAGKPMFQSTDDLGYCRTTIASKRIRAHTVAFVIMTGEYPQGEVDHINGDRADNRWMNLRGVSRGENSKNLAMRSDNTSGITGVVWHAAAKKWQASISSNRKTVYLGLFSDIDDASRARKAAEVELGFSNRHGQAAQKAIGA